MKKRALSILLSLVLVLGLVPVSTFADSADPRTHTAFAVRVGAATNPTAER